MKQTKKIIAAMAAATMVASCAGVVASADEAVNAVNVSYSTVAETFTAADGTVVPAGATAVTLSIENNTECNCRSAGYRRFGYRNKRQCLW